MNRRLAIDVRPKQGDFVVARLALFLGGRAVIAWLVAAVISVAAWIPARALGSRITLIFWPILAALIAVPIAYVFAGVGGKRVRAIVEKGEAWELDDDGLAFDGAKHAWSEVDRAIELARVFAITIGDELHVAPWKSLGTRESLKTLRALLHAHVAKRQ